VRQTCHALYLSLAILFALEPPSEREKWIAVTAGEFHIFSNATERETVIIASKLLRMRDALGAVTALKVRSSLPTKVFIFRDARNFAPFRLAMFPRSNDNVTGMFAHGEESNFILLTADSPEIDRTVYHELTHQFVRNTLPGLPLWLNEGLAEYYSTFRSSADTIDLGMIIPGHVQWLKDNPLIPLDQLFAMDEKSKDYNEGIRQGVFYAESWALVHYLMSQKQLENFLHNGQSPENLERDLRSYVHKYMFEYSRYKVADLPASSIPQAHAMTRDEILYQLGDTLVHSGRANRPDGVRFLQAALKINPDHAGAHADLGLATGDIAEYEKAVQSGTHDSIVYIRYGTSILLADTAKARALFAKAVALDPESALAHAGFGATYVTSPDDPSPGIAALEKSLALAPAQKEVAFNLVQLYLRADRNADAQRLTETTIAHSGDRQMLRDAREFTLDAEVQRADSLLDQGKIDEAIPLLRRAQAATTSERLRTYTTTALQRIEEYASRKRQLEALNAAVNLANGGKMKDALAAVEAVLPSITDPDLLLQAKGLRDALAKDVKRH
jgi:tetratricopeptide (TPR) repeat protein